MNIHEQLEKILADLGVEMDYAEREQPNEHSIPEVSIFQSSRDHYGVFYRLDIIDHVPQLRVMVPIENGLLKVEIYFQQGQKTSDKTFMALMLIIRSYKCLQF